VHACLQALGGGAMSPDDPSAQRLVELLHQHGVLVDESAVMPLVGSTSHAGTLPRPAGAALARKSGTSALEAASARARTRVQLSGFGHPSGTELLSDLSGLLAKAGLRTRRRRNDHVPGAVPVVGVLVGVGEPDREVLDEWMRQAMPFLLVRVVEGRTVVGPFVQPGTTACVRCIDAHHTDADPSWPLLVQQYARATARDRCDGTPEPVDPAQVAAALALATHDVATYVDGLEPNSWSATVTVDIDLAEVRRQPWQRHPDCGCWWG
jgi:bacteriocin biosynthesis cyclodehydratase domain-containing protein